MFENEWKNDEEKNKVKFAEFSENTRKNELRETEVKAAKIREN